jgi:hypothetical protein
VQDDVEDVEALRRVEELRARVEIEDAILRYCRGVDRRDWELARSAYHDDAIDEHGPYNGPVDGFIEYLASRHGQIEHSMHFVSNVAIEFRGAEHAVAETYCIAYQRFAPSSEVAGPGALGARLSSLCRYLDTFERREERWAITHRTVVYGDRSVEQASEPPVFPPGGVLQQRDRSDRFYSL